MPIDRLFRILLSEAFLHRQTIIRTFMAVNVIALMAALMWPKGYSAAAIILVEDKNIIQSLMQGAAVSTDVADRSKMVRQIVYGRKVMNEILEFAGWKKKYPDADDQERITRKLIRKTEIVNLGKNLIKIDYSDENPERAYLTAQKLAELFITESLDAKIAESQAAYDFIDNQTAQYKEKLVQAENALKNYRSENLDALPGSEMDVAARLTATQTRIEQAQFDLREAEFRKQSLEKQLAGEAETVTAFTREGQYRTQIGELQSQIDTLRLSFQDAHPDIVRLRHQIEDLNQAIVDDRKRRETAKAAGRPVVDENIANNPIYMQLRAELSTTKISIDTLRARIADGRRQLQMETARGKRVHGSGATLAELTRDYQVNNDIYQDLLKRRETARVSMNLDRDKQGLTVKIYEPATLPLEPSGLRYMHIVMLGMVLSVVLPVGALYGRMKLDPRLRLPDPIERRVKVPVLVSVPHLWSPAETATARVETRQIVMLMGGTMALIVIVTGLRLVGVF